MRGEQQSRNEDAQRDYEDHREEDAVDALRKPAGREGQNQVEEEDLDDPAGNRPDRVCDLIVQLRERGDSQNRAGAHQQRPEALIRPLGPDAQPDRDRDRGDQAAEKPDQLGIGLGAGCGDCRGAEAGPQRGGDAPGTRRGAQLRAAGRWLWGMERGAM